MGDTEIDVGLIRTYINSLPEKALNLGIRVVLALVIFFIGAKLIRLIRKLIRKALQKGNADVGVIQFLDSFIKAVLYIVLIMGIGSSFGLDAASVVALVGSAGVAIGLAIQGSLSNFAGGVLILLLKPFRVGDYIIEDNKGNEGTVSEIQLFYTKLLTPDGKIIILPNGNLANTSMKNVTATDKRRLDVTVGIAYSADLQAAKGIMLEIMQQDEASLKEEEMIVFVEELAEYSVIVKARCSVPSNDYLTAKWRMTEAVKMRFDAAEIMIPYRTVDVHVKENK